MTRSAMAAAQKKGNTMQKLAGFIGAIALSSLLFSVTIT